MITKVKAFMCTCERCGFSKVYAEPPKRCARCKSPAWDRAEAPDFTYTFHEGFYSLYPETALAQEAVNVIIEKMGSNKLLPSEFNAFRKQAYAAGYSVKMAKVVSDGDLDELKRSESCET